MMDENIQQFQEIMRESGRVQSLVNPMLDVAGVLEDGLATDYITDIGGVKNEAEALKDSWHLTEADDESLFYQRDVLLPYFVKSLDSLSARVELAKEGELLDSKRAYELSLRVEGLTLEDVDGALDDYHKSVDGMLELQRKLDGSLSQHSIHTRGTWHYERKCGRVVDELDELASHLFGIEIVTPADIDVKEKSPHQFLGRINIGYENFMPSLVRVVAHEGPFGHNTHVEMTNSARTPFRGGYRHTAEGLAILGEVVAMTMRYDMDDEQNGVIVDYLEAKRLANDALAAASEKLMFYDQLSTGEIADKLASRTFPRDAILQGLNGLENSRDRSFRFAGTPYYAGHKAVKEVYNTAMEALDQMTDNSVDLNHERGRLFNVMFTGHRPVSTMADEVNFHLAYREKLIREKGPSLVDVPQQYR